MERTGGYVLAIAIAFHGFLTLTVLFGLASSVLGRIP